jgi:hypothetical protein
MELGRLLPGAVAIEPEQKGANDTLKGIVGLFNGPPVECYAKFLSQRQLVNELAAVELAHELDLQAPRAFLIAVMRDEYPDALMFEGNSNAEGIAFAVEALAFPDLRRRYPGSAQIWGPKLRASWDDWSKAAAFDEWIANGDRHEGNLIIGDAGDVWLIDHSHAFTSESWTLQHLTAIGLSTSIANRLASNLAPLLSSQDYNREIARVEGIQKDAESISVASKLDESMASAFLTAEEIAALLDFLELRKGAITTNIQARLGIGLT